MDGSQTLFAEVKDSEEATRQAEIYARAMQSIREKEKRREAQGYAVMSAMTSGEGLSDTAFMKYTRMFLIAFVCVMPVLAFWAIAL